MNIMNIFERLNAKSTKNRLEIIIAIVLVAVIVLGLLFFVFRVGQNVVDNGETTDENQDRGIQPIDIQNSKEFGLIGKTITLPEGYEIGTAFVNARNSGLSCNIDEESKCTIYFIINQDVTFYVSSPNSVEEDNEYPVKPVNKILQTKLGDIEFTFDMLKIANAKTLSDGTEELTEEVSSIVAAIRGCTVANNICFSTGNLPQDATNAARVQLFTEFVAGVNVL